MDYKNSNRNVEGVIYKMFDHVLYELLRDALFGYGSERLLNYIRDYYDSKDGFIDEFIAALTSVCGYEQQE